MAGGQWWRDAIGYEVYLPSFQDSDGDGWGDLPGVISRLDALARLGVNLLWITPFFRSPMHDHGYDISDYRAVDPRFGTLADVDRLLSEAHRRGIRVISDLVVNHTSNEHPWFEASRSDRGNSHRDFYVWRPGRGNGDEPPNNWVGTFGGPAWTRDEATGEWYLHLFTPQQPDLNWDNPKVADEVEAIMRFWLDRGLDGFRVDTATYLAKNPELPDNPLLPADQVRIIGGAVADWYRYDHRHDIGQRPRLREIHRRWRMIADDYDALLVGETHVLDPATLATYLDGENGLHSMFYFGLIQAAVNDGETEADLLRRAADSSDQLSWVQSSHDWTRAATRYGADRALALATLAIGLPGALYLYQGDELGLTNAEISPAEAQDPLARQGGNHEHNRDAVRTPMPWEPTATLGFTTAERAWLPFGDRQPTETVAVQAADQDSSLNLYGRLIAARRTIPDLRNAAGPDFGVECAPVRWLDTPPGVTAYRRGDTIVAANLADRPQSPDLTVDWAVEFATPGAIATMLPPNGAVILRRTGK